MGEAGWIIALWAAMMPVVMMMILFIPPYAMAVLALWILYGDTVLAYWGDVSRIGIMVERLYVYWQTEPSASFIHFFVPVFGPMILGVLISLYGAYRFYKYIRGVFRP